MGGAEKVLEIIAKDQLSQGHNVVILSFEKTSFDSFYSHLNVQHCEVSYEFSFLSKKKIKIEEYEEKIRIIDPQIIHSHSYWTDLISHHNLRKAICYITHFHLNYDNFPSFDFFSTLRSKRNLMHYLDKLRLLVRYKKPNCHFIAASNFIHTFYEKRFPSSVMRKMAILSNPVDDRYFHIRPLQMDFELLTIGRLEHVKNQSFLVNVVHHLKKNNIGVRLAVVGDGSLNQKLQDEARDLGIANQVFFLGAKKDAALVDIFSRSKLYVHASKNETFGLAIYEARAAGIPVLALKFEGMDEVMLRDASMTISPNESIEEYANQIVKLLALPVDQYNEICKTARRLTLPFSERNFCKKMKEFYANVVD